MERERIETGRRPGRPRSGEAHAAILQAAVDLVREVGYDAVGMEAIASRAGVGKATVYRRWPGKELLIAEAIEHLMRAMPVPETGTTRGDLMVLMRIAVGMYGDPSTGPLLSGLVAAMARSERIAHSIRTGFVGMWQEAARRVLNDAVARGDLRQGLDVELAVDLLAGPLFYRFLITGRLPDEPFASAIVDSVLRAFAPDEAEFVRS